jgi:diphthamide biosynthesis enzyme Dph1/Dph2-like protein
MLRFRRNKQLPKSEYEKKFLFHSTHLSLLLQIALQFPDFLLPDAVKVTAELQRVFAEKQFFILGDTSYGRYIAAYWSFESVILYVCEACVIPYSGKFSWGPVFAVFTDKQLSTKVRPVK